MAVSGKVGEDTPKGGEEEKTEKKGIERKGGGKCENRVWRGLTRVGRA